MSPECPSRATYLEVKQRAQPKRIIRSGFPNSNNTYIDYSTHFPNTLQQKTTSHVSNWGKPDLPNSNNQDLFSFEELKTLTVELITNLSKCKTRSDQFEVITNLAFKFLSR